MAHFRGQIRGPHWGAKRDNILIDFWKRHECLFNSSLESFYDRDTKTKLWSECALLIGKSVSDVVRRSRSLRTQYGRVLWHPERVSTFQQRMLREKLDFLRPYIVRRRGDSYPDDKSDDHEDDEGEIETEGSNDHETGTSTFGSPLDDYDAGQDPHEEFPSEASTSNPSSYCANTQSHLAETMSLSFEPHEKSSPDAPDQLAANLSNHDVLNQFVNVMLADMRQIKDNMVLIRLRRDITDLVFKAVEEDMHRRNPVPFTQPGEKAQLPSSSRPQTCLQRVFKRKNRGPVKHMRRFCRNQAGQVLEDINGTIPPQAIIQASEVKLELDPHVVKTEDETLTVL
ncbi:uncharacterized protein LOC144060602 [Vanacampus margaritifer]